MKLRRKFLRTFSIFLFSFVALSISFTGVNEALNPKNAQFIPKCEYLRNTCLLVGAECVSSNNQSSEVLNLIFNPLFSFALFSVFLLLIWTKVKTKKTSEIIKLFGDKIIEISSPQIKWRGKESNFLSQCNPNGIRQNLK